MEEQMLVTCMRELVDERHVEKGNFKLSALKALERMMHTRLEGCQLLAVPHIKSKVRYFKDKFAALLELKQASGFGWDETRGCVVADDDVFNGWVKVMEDLLNQGIDMHATRLKDVEAEITSKAAGTKGKASGTSSGSKRSRQLFTDDDRLRLAGTMASASDNLARIANNYCIEGDLAVRRQYLYQELSTFPDLTFGQRTRIMRHLNRDDGDATTYFQLPTSEEKLAFVWNFLQ
ncbi:hypothetical protein LINPERPRIM_LOCUS36667 [Linum perenne]